MVRTCTPDIRWAIALLALVFLEAPASVTEHAYFLRAAELCDRGDWRAAEPLLRDALTRFGAEDNDEVWEMRLLFGEALVGRGKPRDAEAILAGEPPKRLRHSAIAIRRLLQQGLIAYRLQDSTAAQRHFKEAEILAREYQRPMLADVFGRRAVVETAKQDFQSAERDLRDAIHIAQANGDRILELNPLGSMARLRTLQHRYDEAVDFNRRALALATSIGSESKIEKVSGNLGWTYVLLGDFDSASEVLINALAIAERIGADFDVVPWLDNLGDIAMHNRDFVVALRYYERGIKVARRIDHRDISEFIANIAMVRLALGEIDDARLANKEAVSRSGNNPEQRLRSLLIDARIDIASGMTDSAIAKAQQVINEAKSKSQRWEAQARLAQFYVAAKRPNDAEEQFRQALETAAETRNEVRNEELRLPFGALVREVNEEYVDFLLKAGRVDDALDVAEASRAQTLAESLDTKASPQRVHPKRLAGERHAVFLSYWLAPKCSYVWVITPSSIEVSVLPPSAVIEHAVDVYRQELVSLRGFEASTVHGRELYRMLVQPVSNRIPLGGRVIVIPDGRLHAFNMETLIDPSSHYWIESVTIDTAASIELLDRSRPAPSSTSMLLVGDPPSPAPEFPRLAKAAEEIGLVRRHFAPACKVLEGRDATPRGYEGANAGRYGYIHFVAHGIATRQRPLDSAVVLARDGDRFKLYARDIIKQHLRARLVTISSCHGAGTRAYSGEGLVGLAWAFLHAGAHQVIASLWEVNDDATPKLMDELYAGIRAGGDPASALRKAKLSLIRGGTVYRQPRYWAPFVIYSGS
jgi:CHAT domain-containing protein